VHIGVLGAGQLGRMLALAGYPLGFRFTFVDPNPSSPAAQLAPHLIANYDDPQALEQLGKTDVVTYEFENVPEAAAVALAGRVPIYPNPVALRIAQDRLFEKTRFQRLDITTSPFVSISSEEDLESALQKLGTPCLLKTRRLGYDGKGQQRIVKSEDGGRAFEALGRVPCLLEQWITFSRELSLLCARSTSGELAFYPLVQNVHHEGILRMTLAPAPGLTEALQQLAQQYAERLLRDLDYVGVLAIEFFDVGGQLLANEFAPRVHNSGHFTIEGAVTSQFENHLRAITNFPLGDTSIRGSVAMLNLVGAMPNPVDVLVIKDAHLHDYGKEPRAGRKLGHITLVARNETERAERLAAIEPALVSCGALPRDVILNA